MERLCTQCHAVLADQVRTDWCPACGGALVARNSLSEESDRQAEVDHRGIVLPRRNPVGGIITPV
ncbi:MAG TPA: hypothetical protein VME23_13560 [Terracidiphilus sp.]|jgi:hypothetical protein|nr:hypothetical protein [Terracidiphilus sp.]